MSLEAFFQKFGQVTESYFFYNGEVELRYAPKEHIYYLVKGDDLEPQEGVTSICHIIDKSEALIPWAVKMMAAKLLSDGAVTLPDGTRIMRQMSHVEYENLVLASKTAHKDKLEEAGEVGHIAHDWIEQYIKAVLNKDQTRIEELLAKFPADERARNCCFAALEWMKNHNVRWIATERKVYSRRYKYAGTMDGLCLVDSCSDHHCCKQKFKDRLTISDWKTSNYLYPEYLLQTAAYMNAYTEEMLHEDPLRSSVTDRWIIRLGKEDGEFQTWHAGFEDYLTDINAFLEALRLKRSMDTIKYRVKKRDQETRAEIKTERKALKEAEEKAEKERKALERDKLKNERLEALKLKCGRADIYKGTRLPKCGCLTCLTKFSDVQEAKKLSLSLTNCQE